MAPARADVYVDVADTGELRFSDLREDAAQQLFLRDPPLTRAPLPPAAPARRRALQALVEGAAQRHGVDPALLDAVIATESAFRADAVSPRGAMGLMQLMPATARELGVDDAFDPQRNVDAGARHLRMLLDRYRGDVRLALAAYNAGASAVERHGNAVPPYRETADYVRRIEARLAASRRGVGL